MRLKCCNNKKSRNEFRCCTGESQMWLVCYAHSLGSRKVLCNAGDWCQKAARHASACTCAVRCVCVCVYVNRCTFVLSVLLASQLCLQLTQALVKQLSDLCMQDEYHHILMVHLVHKYMYMYKLGCQTPQFNNLTNLQFERFFFDLRIFKFIFRVTKLCYKS